MIKSWRIYSIAPMSEIEVLNFQKGQLWFGPNSYKKISKYFLPHRSAEFLKQNDNEDAGLQAKRGLNYFDFNQNEKQDSQELNENALKMKEKMVCQNDENFMMFLKEIQYQEKLDQISLQQNQVIKNKTFSIQLNPLKDFGK